MWTTFAASSAFNDSIDSIAFYLSKITEGELGTPRPYIMRHDDLLMLLLVVCCVSMLIAIGSSLYPLKERFREFFFSSSAAEYDMPPSIPPLMFFLCTMTCLTLALCSFFYIDREMEGFFVVDSNMVVVGAFFAAFIVYFLLKWFVYGLVNNVLFGSKKSLQWSHAFFFVIALEGALLFPLPLLMVYFDLPVENGVYYFIFVLFLSKILTFFKSRSIFFRQKILILQNFLYFCALEMTPLLAFCGAWLMLAHILKVNF